LDELQNLISDIANSVNEMAWHSNRFRLLLDETPVLMELKKLNRDVRRFIRSRINQQKKTLQNNNKGKDLRQKSIEG
jgi:hypothetical protein